MTEQTKDLYEKAKNLYREIVTLEQDLSQLAEDYTFDKENNESGLDIKQLKDTLKATETWVRNSVEKVEEKIAKEQNFLELYKELSGEYD